MTHFFFIYLSSPEWSLLCDSPLGCMQNAARTINFSAVIKKQKESISDVSTSGRGMIHIDYMQFVSRWSFNVVVCDVKSCSVVL